MRKSAAVAGEGRPQGQIAGLRVLLALCHPPTLPARAPSGWSQPGRGGAPTVACVGLFWGAEAVARGGGRSVTFIRVPRVYRGQAMGEVR
jgi:hypothetical protein